MAERTETRGGLRGCVDWDGEDLTCGVRQGDGVRAMGRYRL